MYAQLESISRRMKRAQVRLENERIRRFHPRLVRYIGMPG